MQCSDYNIIQAIATDTLMFIDDESLTHLVTSSRFSEQKVLTGLSEMFVRYFLSGYKLFEAEINTKLQDDELEQCSIILSFIDKNRHSLDERKLWHSSDAFSQKCENSVRKRLSRLFQADGFIPVCNAKTAFFIPFELKLDSDKDSKVIDSQNKEIALWSKAVQNLNIEDKLIIKLQCGESEESFFGASLMLPVLLAYWRKKEQLPQYDIFRLLSTGAFSTENELQEVKIAKKIASFKEKFPRDAVMIAPATYATGDYQIEPINTGNSYDSIKSITIDIIERHNMAKPTLGYARTRLKELFSEVRFENYSRWEKIIAKLNYNAQPIAEHHPEEYMLTKLLLSEACCHAGATEKARQFNDEARIFASKHEDFSQTLYLLEIERLVILLDSERFSDIAELDRDFNNYMESLEDPDLRMRYCGTMGQICTYGYLAGISNDKFTSENAKDYFLKAVNFANHLGNQIDIAQDLNYVHLWHAFFDPCSDAEEKAYKNAQNQIMCNLQNESESVRLKNLFYLKRQKALALYRHFLKTGAVGVIKGLNLPAEADDWLFAITNKYIATLEVASNNIEKGIKRFKTAETALSKAEEPIKVFMLMTIFAQAYWSLSNIKPILAEDYRNSAIDLFTKNNNFKQFILADRWYDFLTEKTPFPGLSYWY